LKIPVEQSKHHVVVLANFFAAHCHVEQLAALSNA